MCSPRLEGAGQLDEGKKIHLTVCERKVGARVTCQMYDCPDGEDFDDEGGTKGPSEICVHRSEMIGPS